MAYKVKPPKCGCEFWRRERRVKKAPNDEIIVLKIEMAEIRGIIATIINTRVEHSSKVSELGYIMSGHRENIRSIAKVTTISKEQKRAAKIAEKTFRAASDKSYKLSLGVHYLLRLHNQMHLRCLEIRDNERKGIVA